MYRGRIAPSPTGYLHAGHAVTFWHAQRRVREASGRMVLRIEDLDPQRCREKFTAAAFDDLRWFGLEWDEGPDIGGAFGPYVQSDRRALYLEAWRKLRDGHLIYPCRCSRKDVQQAALAPHGEDEEPIYSGTCRPRNETQWAEASQAIAPGGVHWRFRVPDGEQLCFVDEYCGEQVAIAGRNFGDFVVWRKDNVPAYQLAVVVDDAAMRITEVVRGQDLLTSTFRQLLLYQALLETPPHFYHTSLVHDETGKRLAKRDAARSLRALREEGISPDEIRSRHL